jgi:hypothetical protein
LQWGDDRGVRVSLLCDPFSLVTGDFALEDGIAQQLVGVGNHAPPAGQVVVVDRGVGAACGLACGDQRRVPRSCRGVL